MNTDDYIINNHSLIDVRNIYEVRVIRWIKKLADRFPEFDGCRNCVEDVYALALSRIPPTYVRSEKQFNEGDLADEDLKEIVNYALYQVSSNPNHSRD